MSAAYGYAKEVVQVLDLPEDQRVLVTCMLWRWWNRRNKVNAGEKKEACRRNATVMEYWASESIDMLGAERVAETNGRRPQNHCGWGLS